MIAGMIARMLDQVLGRPEAAAGPAPPWPFAQPPDAPCITLRRVLRGDAPVLRAARDADGDWQFLDGAAMTEADAAVVGLGEMLRRDPMLAAVASLPPGAAARRDAPGAPWRRDAPSAPWRRDAPGAPWERQW